MKLLEIENVSRKYQRGGWFGKGREVVAVDGLSLTIMTGQSVGVIGRSGAGKSSLGRLVLGLERPNSGTIRYRGKPLAQFARDDWRQFRSEVQIVFQNALGSVNPHWPVAEILAEPLRNHLQLSRVELRSRVQELLEMVGLRANDAERYPSQFSGGQLQRICIARALALQPRLIVLDEAVSSLDMLVQAQVLALLRQLQERTGVSYLFISHDLRIVSGFCSEVHIMDKGRITSRVEEMKVASLSADQVLRELAGAILPAWPAELQQEVQAPQLARGSFMSLAVPPAHGSQTGRVAEASSVRETV